MTLPRISLAALLLVAAAFAWSSNAQGGEPAGIGDYRIGPADVLQISVWKNEDLTRTMPVRPDGMISMPLVNEVRAAGLTPEELRDLLVRRLSAYMPNPEVSVIVEEVHSFSVSVLGEVKTPGHYEQKSRATVLNVLAQAGGFTEFATRSRILILRREGEQMRRIPFNYEKVASSGDMQENYLLQPGDVILVP